MTCRERFELEIESNRLQKSGEVVKSRFGIPVPIITRSLRDFHVASLRARQGGASTLSDGPVVMPRLQSVILGPGNAP